MRQKRAKKRDLDQVWKWFLQVVVVLTIQIWAKTENAILRDNAEEFNEIVVLEILKVVAV